MRCGNKLISGVIEYTALMNAITPLLIAIGLALPVVGLSAVLLVYIHRHKQPDKARLKVFRGLLWFIAVVVLTGLTAAVVLAVRGDSSPSPAMWFLTLLPSIGLAVVCALEIRQCQKRLGRR